MKKKYSQEFWYRNLYKKKLLEAISLNESMILKCILKTWT
jgi:hypothetical protein